MTFAVLQNSFGENRFFCDLDELQSLLVLALVTPGKLFITVRGRVRRRKTVRFVRELDVPYLPVLGGQELYENLATEIEHIHADLAKMGISGSTPVLVTLSRMQAELS